MTPFTAAATPAYEERQSRKASSIHPEVTSSISSETDVNWCILEEWRSLGAEVIVLLGDAAARAALQDRRAAALERMAQRGGRARPPADGMDTLTLLREDRAR